jgi:hypothetical protein
VNDIKPTIFLEVWRSPIWGIAWAVRSFTTVRQFNEEYDYHFHFYGKTATVHTGTDDYDISKDELFHAAVSHMKGDCVTYQFDLKNCIVTQIDGRPPTPDY